MDVAVSRRVRRPAAAAGRSRWPAATCRSAHLSARATDEWTHTYPLAPGGEIRIVNTNGRIDVEGVDGSTVEVRAERIARGATDAAARELLPRIVIKEDVKPDRVSLETERMSGIMIGAALRSALSRPRAEERRRQRDQHQRPGRASTALSGKVVAHTTNGGVKGNSLDRRRRRARRPTAASSIDMASVGAERDRAARRPTAA